jgi:prepilin-type N-terminal cleavage/methylation domain-containing protein
VNHSSNTSGFSLSELVVTTLILGLIAAVGGSSLISIATRERANTVASELAGWLDQVNRDASRFSAETSGGTPCIVTINTGNGLLPGALMATIAPESCAVQNALAVPDLYSDDSTVQITASPRQFVFTPRGTVATSSGAPLPDAEVQITISVNSLPPLRCIRLTGLIGVLEVGRNNQAGPGGTCDEWSRV